MYAEYYGLSRKPFENTPDPLFLFQSKSHSEVLASLVYGIRAAKGLIVVVGDIGTGKTTLIHALLAGLDPSYITLKITNPRLAFTQSTIDSILKYFAKELGISAKNADGREIVEIITRELEAQDKKGQRAVLIIDEAHLLTEESLHDIRLLSNIENEKRKLIQIVLTGQTELQRKLQEDSLRSFKQRISISRKLMPLDKSETEEYVNHRIRIAGRKDLLFKRRALSLIFAKSHGIPRLINQICDDSLVIGYATQTELIDAGIVKEVINDLNSIYGRNKIKPVILFRKLGRLRPYALLSVLVALGLIYYIVLKPFVTPDQHKKNGLTSVSKEHSLQIYQIPNYPVKTPKPGTPLDLKDKVFGKEGGELEQGPKLPQSTEFFTLNKTGGTSTLPKNRPKTDKNTNGREGLYMIKKGDTLFKIAGDKDVYGDPLKWPSLFRLNMDAIIEMDLTDDFEHRALPEALILRSLTPQEAKKNLTKLGHRAWVINILSAYTSNAIVPLAINLMKNGYHVYITRANVQGKELLRLRVGFFKGLAETSSATEALSSLINLDDFWVTTSEKELREFGGY